MAKVTTTKTAVTYNLQLTEMEAKTLLSVLGRIGGCNVSSMRHYTDRISRALGAELDYDSVKKEFVWGGVTVVNGRDLNFASLYFAGPKLEERCPEDDVK